MGFHALMGLWGKKEEKGVRHCIHRIRRVTHDRSVEHAHKNQRKQIIRHLFKRKRKGSVVSCSICMRSLQCSCVQDGAIWCPSQDFKGPAWSSSM